jgi:hypothetical protein
VSSIPLVSASIDAIFRELNITEVYSQQIRIVTHIASFEKFLPVAITKEETCLVEEWFRPRSSIL